MSNKIRETSAPPMPGAPKLVQMLLAFLWTTCGVVLLVRAYKAGGSGPLLTWLRNFYRVEAAILFVASAAIFFAPERTLAVILWTIVVFVPVNVIGKVGAELRGGVRRVRR